MKTSGKLAAAVVTTGVGAALALGTTAALAAPAPVAPTAADIAAAQQVAGSQATHARLANFFADYDQHQAGHLITNSVSKTAAQAEAPRIVSPVRQVYALNPAFVRATSANVPVATFSYLAVSASSAKGEQATLWLTKGTAGWRVFNIISGNQETAYPAQAAAGQVFTEPQIHAWYRYEHGTVVGLDREGRATVGAHGVSLSAYQRIVHQRYGDKLPGSAYQRQGKLGGYQPGPLHATRQGGGPSPVAVMIGIGGLALTAGSVLAWRRRAVRSTAL